jgi:hypothetical protein
VFDSSLHETCVERDFNVAERWLHEVVCRNLNGE